MKNFVCFLCFCTALLFRGSRICSENSNNWAIKTVIFSKLHSDVQMFHVSPCSACFKHAGFAFCSVLLCKNNIHNSASSRLWEVGLTAETRLFFDWWSLVWRHNVPLHTKHCMPRTNIDAFCQARVGCERHYCQKILCVYSRHSFERIRSGRCFEKKACVRRDKVFFLIIFHHSCLADSCLCLLRANEWPLIGAWLYMSREWRTLCLHCITHSLTHPRGFKLKSSLFNGCCPAVLLALRSEKKEARRGEEVLVTQTQKWRKWGENWRMNSRADQCIFSFGLLAD